MIHICTSIIGQFGIWEMSAFYWMKLEMVYCQNVSHPAGDMPARVCLVPG